MLADRRAAEFVTRFASYNTAPTRAIRVKMTSFRRGASTGFGRSRRDDRPYTALNCRLGRREVVRECEVAWVREAAVGGRSTGSRDDDWHEHDLAEQRDLVADAVDPRVAVADGDVDLDAAEQPLE